MKLTEARFGLLFYDSRTIAPAARMAFFPSSNLRLFARFHRWRLATTKYWLPYERQLHWMLLADVRLSAMRDLLACQFATLFQAHRSLNISELAATYSYQCSQFFEVADEFTLCSIRASNAEGVIRFGGGMLSEIRLSPTLPVVNPVRFQLEEITLNQIFIPHTAASPTPTGWVAEFETGGLIRRFGLPRDAVRMQADSLALRQYEELFAHCSEAELVCPSESFHFLPPDATTIVNARSTGARLPILDLRELGGLAITPGYHRHLTVSLVSDGEIVWAEPDLVTAIKRIHAELAK